MNCKSSKSTWIVVYMMPLVDGIDTWVMEAIVLPECPSIGPECCKHDFDSIVSVASEKCSFLDCLLKCCGVAISLHGKRPGTECSYNIKTEERVSNLFQI